MYTSSWEDGEEDARMGPCCKEIEGRTRIMGECEMYKEERDVLRDEENRSMWHGQVLVR